MEVNNGDSGVLNYKLMRIGSGFLYARKGQLYRRVKTDGSVKYLKCVKGGTLFIFS